MDQVSLFSFLLFFFLMMIYKEHYTHFVHLQSNRPWTNRYPLTFVKSCCTTCISEFISQQMKDKTVVYPVTLSSCLNPSKPCSTSPMSTFLRHAFFPFLLDWLCWEGAPRAERLDFFDVDLILRGFSDVIVWNDKKLLSTRSGFRRSSAEPGGRGDRLGVLKSLLLATATTKCLYPASPELLFPAVILERIFRPQVMDATRFTHGQWRLIF